LENCDNCSIENVFSLFAAQSQDPLARGAAGIQASYCNGCAISSSVVRLSGTGLNNGKGVRIANSQKCTLIGLRILESFDYGILLEQSSHNNVVDGCLSYNNGKGVNYGAGIFVNDSSYCMLSGNRCFDDANPRTQQFGIRLYGSTNDSFVAGNNVWGNVQHGVLDSSNFGTQNRIGINYPDN
jgi:parallel beta-helix repeat protein